MAASMANAWLEGTSAGPSPGSRLEGPSRGSAVGRGHLNGTPAHLAPAPAARLALLDSPRLNAPLDGGRRFAPASAV